MARFTATEMVGVPLTSAEVRRLLAALDGGGLGPPGVDGDDVILRQKLTVLLQVAEAGERRRASAPRTEATTRPPRRPR